MRMRKAITVLTVLAVFMVCSCSNANKEYAMSADLAMEESSLQAEDQKSQQVETVERKVIKQGDIKFETTDIDKTKSLVIQTVQKLDGYIAKDNVYDYANRLEHSLIIRVPADKFDLLLENISESINKLDNKSIDILDITEEYIDIEARIKTKKELQDKYIDLLKRATRVEEILTIEKEIGNLQTEIESVEGRMRYLKDKIAFSTLTVTYYQKTVESFGFSSKFIDGIKSGWDVFLWFIVGVSYLWVFALVVIVTVYLVRVWRKKKRAV